MRIGYVVVLPVALVLALTGCSAPLTAKAITTNIGVSAPADALIGDPVKLEASATLAAKRTDTVVLRLQSSTDGTTWTTITQKSAKGPKVELKTASVAKAAGTVKYRATVSATTKSKKPISVTVTSAATTVTTSAIKELVRKFYYDRTTAYSTSSAAGAAWDAANDSSAYDQTAPTWVSNMAAVTAAKDVETSVPDLTTISPDPTWKLTGSSCNAAMTAPPSGRTFIVTVALGGSYDGFPKAASTADLHVTLLNGKLVDYIEGCGS